MVSHSTSFYTNMDVNEEAEILARLGILHSTEESPNKDSTLKLGSGFVDVNINGEVDTDNEDDAIFDRNTLLSGKNRHLHVHTKPRQNTDTPFCRYLLLLVSFFVAGVATHSCPDTLQLSKRMRGYGITTANALGLLTGVFIARLWVPRINSTWLLFVSVTSLVYLSWSLLFPCDAFQLNMIAFVQGFCVSTIQYGGISTWFMWWRSSKRKVLWMIAIFTLGMMFPLIIQSNDVNFNGTSVSGSHAISKRTLNETNQLESFTSSLFSLPETVTVKPKKPDTAVGTQEIETKTKVNEERRKEAVNAADLSNTDVFNSTETIRTAVPITVSTNTSTTATTTRTTTTTMATIPTTASTTMKPKRLEVASGAGGDLVRGALEKFSPLISDIPEFFSAVDPSIEMVVFVTLSLCAALFIISFAICCLSFNIVADSRVAKLSDHSCPGLTAGCRLRLVIVHILASFLAGLLFLMANQVNPDGNDSFPMIVCGSTFLVAIFSVLLGTHACGFAYGWCLLWLCLIGALSISFGFSMPLGLLIAGGAGTMMNTIIFLQVESKVSARPRLNLDILCFSVVGGRILLLALDFFAGHFSVSGLSVLILNTTLSLFVAYFISNRTVYKAARLKGIYEYTEENAGEHRHLTFRGDSAYTTLIEASISSDEDSV